MSNEKISVTISLSRAHKIVERLKTKLSELNSIIVSGFGVVNVEGYTGSEQIKLLENKYEEAVDAYARYNEYLVLMTEIRKTIGLANSSVVAPMLAEQAMYNSKLYLLKSILSKDRSSAIMPKDLETYRPLVQTERSPLLHRSNGVPVTLLTQTRKQMIETEIDEIQRKLYAISDKITDANSVKVEILLPKTVAEELGL